MLYPLLPDSVMEHGPATPHHAAAHATPHNKTLHIHTVPVRGHGFNFYRASYRACRGYKTTKNISILWANGSVLVASW